MTGATICSGILAPEVAMPWVDWKWCAEVENFCCELIQQRKGLLNLGDVLAHDFLSRAAALGPLDLLVAGTPCQAFSVAGLRRSMKDARGNLTLRFVECVHELKPMFTLWENVPGVLSTHDNAFGCFLAGLVGADDPIVSPAGWSRAGVVDGPLGSAAWRILDAQYFGLAQRRERVFVVFCFREGPHPAEILFEWESLRRDSPPSREAGQTTAGTLSARTEGGGGLGTDFDLGGGIQPHQHSPAADGECRGQERAVNAHRSTRYDFESETFCVTHSLKADGFDASEDGTGCGTPLVPVVSPTLRAGKNATGGDRPPGTDVDTCETLIPVPILEAGARTGASTDDPRAGIGVDEPGDPMFTLQSGHHHAVAFDTTQMTSKANRSNPKPGDPYHPLAKDAHPPAVAFTERTREQGRTLESQDELAYALTNPGSGGRTHSRQIMTPTFGVRRLTPTECERLQGFPDGYTAITRKGKEAADGPRYRSLGNSMAVPVLAWIGRRIVEAAGDRPSQLDGALCLAGGKQSDESRAAEPGGKA